MTLLAITGATGFVGSAVLNEALSQGHQVKALARREQPSRAGVAWVRGDLADTAALAALCAGADAVIHVAGLTNTPDPAEFDVANVTGTAHVMAAMQGAGVRRLVFVSSLAAREPKLSAYGASKAKAEALVEASGLDWTTVRPPAVYGPRDIDMLDLFRAAKWGVVPLPPGGATSIIHADDLASLLVTLAASNAAPTKKKTYEPDDGREVRRARARGDRQPVHRRAGRGESLYCLWHLCRLQKGQAELLHGHPRARRPYRWRLL